MKVELIHPLLVHFPLALLLVGTILRAISGFYKRVFLGAAWLVLAIGVCFAWLAILAGRYAAEIVAPNLCDVSVLEMHATLAFTAAYLFTGALILDWAKVLWATGALRKVLTVLCFVLFLAGFVDLIIVGGLGGKMVYEQGAAVEKCCRKAAPLKGQSNSERN